MEEIMKKYMDFWEIVTYETFLNPKILSQWQAVMQAHEQWMAPEAEPARDTQA